MAAAGVAALSLGNTSLLAPSPTGTPRILAHRGIHQTYSREGLAPDTCTAARINPPTNPYLENTLPSMRASFAAGADALELDVHPTTDGEFAVFHDWTLDCRTDGTGVTRERPMAYLKTLDIGWGYTADGGRTWPFRGKGVGMMPTLHEALAAFPGKQFLINIKSRDRAKGARLVRYLVAHGHPTDARLWVVGHERPLDAVHALAPEARIMTKSGGKTCVVGYLALGWSGYVPEACRGSVIGVPMNLRWAYWGWPDRFLQRMAAANVQVMLVGPIGRGDAGNPGVPGLLHADQLDAVPAGFPGYVMTDAIEVVGPAAKRRWPDPRQEPGSSRISAPAR